jgi:DNA modification methylase
MTIGTKGTFEPLGYCRQLPRVGIGEPTPPVEVPRNEVLIGDALTRLKRLPSHSVDCAVTSPPYIGIRIYGVAGEIGRESNVDQWVANLRPVMREVARVLKPGGSLWLNLGDAFSTGPRWGAPAKSLLAAPERLLLALMKEGWLVRGRTIWLKPNARPTSAIDRLSLNYEYVYHLVRSQRYYFDLGAIRQPHTTRRISGVKQRPTPQAVVSKWSGPLAGGNQSGLLRARAEGRPGHPDGKNPGSVVTIAPRGYPGHPATFPPALIAPLIKASCPEVVCLKCGMPSRRTDRACKCGVGRIPGLVLDPFFGSGTTGVAAESLGRDWLGIELSQRFTSLANKRISEARRGG